MQISVNTKITGVEKLVFFTSQTPQVKGVIAIHNTLRGPALGGCRIYQRLLQPVWSQRENPQI